MRQAASHFYTYLTETMNHKTMLRNKALALRFAESRGGALIEWALWASGDAAVKAYMAKRLSEVELGKNRIRSFNYYTLRTPAVDEYIFT